MRIKQANDRDRIYAEVVAPTADKPLRVFCSRECAQQALGTAVADATTEDGESFAARYDAALRDLFCDHCGLPIDRVDTLPELLRAWAGYAGDLYPEPTRADEIEQFVADWRFTWYMRYSALEFDDMFYIEALHALEQIEALVTPQYLRE